MLPFLIYGHSLDVLALSGPFPFSSESYLQMVSRKGKACQSDTLDGILQGEPDLLSKLSRARDEMVSAYNGPAARSRTGVSLDGFHGWL